MLLNKYELRKNLPSQVVNNKVELPLPEGSYFCYAPQISLYTEDQLSYFGVPQEGYLDELGNANLNKMILVKWSISEMLDAYINGYRVTLENRADVIKITEAIDEYFETVNNILDVGDGRKYNFDERLEALDGFNKSIYTLNYGTIAARREEIIKKASLKDMAPNVVFQELRQIPILERKDGLPDNAPVNKYSDRAVAQPVASNPLAPVYEQEPTFNFNRNYESRFRDPNERRLAAEYEIAKRKLNEE